ncbi:MAG: preprotein translocase subunit SecE [Lachnospiraceae bacterium]
MGIKMSAKTEKPVKKTSFFKSIKAEFKKISWPAKDFLLKQSLVVVATAVVFGILIAILDFVILYGINVLSM